MAVVLLIQTEDNNVEELPVLNKMILGRSSSADFKVNDQKISSKHCSVELTPKGEVLISDLGSTNGTFLNNTQIHQTLLKINEVLRIGNTYIRVDERKLTMSERVKVGTAKVTQKTDDKTLPEVPDTSILKKKTMIQEIKKKNKTNLASWGSSNDQLIDQEESSGNTRFLKLDKKKK